LKVADFSLAITGAIISRYLSDHGATVIHIESRTHPDPLRLSGPFRGGRTHIDYSGYYAIYNTTKYSLTLNLNHSRGPEVAKRIISWCDVVVENLSPGIMGRWELDYDSVKRMKPDIVYISSSNLGQTGPCANYSGYGNALVSLAGFTQLTGWPDREPSQPYGAYTDILAPRLGVAAVIAALDYHRRTGRGQYLDLSQLESSLHFLSVPFLDYFANSREAVRMGNRSPTDVPHNAYRCQGEDRWCVVAVETQEEWRCFCQVLDNPPWTRDPKFATSKDRKDNEEELDKLVEKWTSQHKAEEVMERLQKAGVAAGVVATAEDISNDPQLQHRQHFQLLEHTEMGNFKFDSHAFRLSRTPAQLRFSPCIGEHTEYVLKEMLGFNEEEYVELLLAGALE
jgi:benzylsuccinate CoA-transferase BbsF subunit